jgi:hypothetical protein
VTRQAHRLHELVLKEVSCVDPRVAHGAHEAALVVGRAVRHDSAWLVELE